MDLLLLKNYGIDYETGLSRCLNDQALYERILEMFLNDDILKRAKAALDAGDHKALFNCMHELKGASGNAAMTKLYAAACPLVDLLRGEDVNEAELLPLFSRMEDAYIKAKEGIVIAAGI